MLLNWNLNFEFRFVGRWITLPIKLIEKQTKHFWTKKPSHCERKTRKKSLFFTQIISGREKKDWKQKSLLNCFLILSGPTEGKAERIVSHLFLWKQNSLLELTWRIRSKIWTSLLQLNSFFYQKKLFIIDHDLLSFNFYPNSIW